MGRLIGSVGLAPGSDSGFDLDQKGQIHGYSSTQFALDVGTANQGLLVDSSATAGIKWGASSTSTLTTTGDLLVASGANTLSRIAGGTSGDVLTAGGAGVVPSYQTPSGGGAWSSLGTDVLTSTNTTMSVTLSSQKKYLMVLVNRIANGALDNESIRFNGSSATDYAYRHATDGAGDSSNVNATGIGVNATNATQNGYLYGFIINNPATIPKLGYFHDMRTNTDYTAGKEPARQLTVGKWQPASGTNVAITAISITTAGSGNYNVDSSLAILGSDG